MSSSARSGCHHQSRRGVFLVDEFPVTLLVRVDAVDEEVFAEKHEGGDPEFTMLDLVEKLPRERHIGEGQRRFVLGADLGGHAAIDVDERIVGERIPGEETSARFERAADLPEELRLVGDVMHGVGGVE